MLAVLGTDSQAGLGMGEMTTIKVIIQNSDLIIKISYISASESHRRSSSGDQSRPREFNKQNESNV